MKVPKPQLPEYIRLNFNKYKYVLLVCLAGLILAAWPSGRAGEQALPETSDAQAEVIQTPALEDSLEETLSHIEGVGRVRVMITLKSSSRSVYAYDTSSSEKSSASDSSTELSSDREQTMVFSEGSERTPIAVRTEAPLYQGAVVVCDGADSASVRLALTEAVRAVTGISSDCISILKMKQ